MLLGVHMSFGIARNRPMKLRHAAVLVVLVACALSPTGALAARSLSVHSSARSGVTLCTFRLRVAGRPVVGTTFWLAYGPLAGKFGLVRLKASQAGLYQASRDLPIGGQTIFAYLSAQGMIHTRLGLAPGGAVTVIRRLGPVRVGVFPVVHWQAPSA